MHYKILSNGDEIFVGSSEDVREKVELLLEDKLDFFVMLQEIIAEDDNLELFVHTETYYDTNEIQEEKLFELGITDDISKDEICRYLEISILDEDTNKISVEKKSA